MNTPPRAGHDETNGIPLMTEDAPGQPPRTPAPPPAPTPRDRGAGSEKYKERGVMLRVFVYVVAGHLMAGFLWLLFYIGAHSH